MNTDILQEIRQRLCDLENKMLAEVADNRDKLHDLHPDQLMSANNLIHYLALRNEDIRNLQDQLHIYGLSSLASAESHLPRQVQAIFQRLGKEYLPEEPDACTYAFSRQQLELSSRKL